MDESKAYGRTSSSFRRLATWFSERLRHPQTGLLKAACQLLYPRKLLLKIRNNGSLQKSIHTAMWGDPMSKASTQKRLQILSLLWPLLHDQDIKDSERDSVQLAELLSTRAIYCQTTAVIENLVSKRCKDVQKLILWVLYWEKNQLYRITFRAPFPCRNCLSRGIFLMTVSITFARSV